MSSPEHKEKIWNLIKPIKIGMLVTHESADKGLRARPMALVQDSYDGTLYFYTSKSDAKVYEIENDKEVCISFAAPENQTYVSLTGKAKLTQDKELIDRYWNEWVAVWFKNEKNHSDIAMLKVKIERGEHWNTNENKFIQLLETTEARLKEDTVPDLGENQEFGT